MYDVQNNLLELLELCIMVPIKSMIKEFIKGESPTHCFNQKIQSLLEKFPAIDFEWNIRSRFEIQKAIDY